MSELRRLLTENGIAPDRCRDITSFDGRLYVTFGVKRDAELLWKKLRDAAPLIGYWPIIVVNTKDVESMLKTPREANESVERVLERAGTINISEWIAAEHAQRLKDYAEFAEEGEETEDPFNCSVDEVEERVSPKSTLYSTSRPDHNGIGFLLVPTSIAAHVPAYLPFGGWNDCPHPEVHVAFHSYWNRKFGSEIAVIAGDVVETFVTAPPTTAQTALALAKEQYAYAYDIVEQGTQTIPALASEIMNSRTWFFWWD